ncbi:MAG TPA: AAC(3) family N-acetyltransferase [Actinocrinis sp.]|uniref:aminoglycoside N(3)-acetyltransferase n=1 Tax=Actinocrinis sp. TaxID=1920516 RepID=UPI002D52C4EB|nr:AAC(3) family N-acetyltransferase [Actinocrinis sp.]HZU58225.1 AAC(3) family N-acetyltransferase [Actinocrinis sp.]
MQAQLRDEFAALGVESDVDILVHASMRALGWIDGGPKTIIAALRDVLGPKPCIVVPTQTTHNSTTSRVHAERIAGMSPAEIDAFRARMEAFDPVRTPSYGMGMLAEHVRCHPESLRSSHPKTSFAALGRDAAQIVRDHPAHCHLGENSPLGALYARGAQVLLLGVGYEKATAFHLAEYRLDQPVRSYQSKVLAADGSASRWVEYEDIDLDDRDFATLGAQMQATQSWVSVGQVGAGRAVRFPLAEAVRYAERWMRENRPMR